MMDRKLKLGFRFPMSILGVCFSRSTTIFKVLVVSLLLLLLLFSISLFSLCEIEECFSPLFCFCIVPLWLSKNCIFTTKINKFAIWGNLISSRIYVIVLILKILGYLKKQDKIAILFQIMT